MCIEEKTSWMDAIKTYLETRALPEDSVKVDKIKKQSVSFYLENGMMYKCGFPMPLLMCLREEEADYVLRELHEGICGNHVGNSSLTLKALRNGYF